MITYNNFKKTNPIDGLRKNIRRTESPVCLDFRLAETIVDPNMESPNHDRCYDLDVYLPTYGINLQRDYVWDYTQQNAFIQSLLYRKDISPFIVIRHEDEERHFTTMQVIDGKQRLTTIRKFFLNEFPVILGDKSFYYDDFDNEMKLFCQRRCDDFVAVQYYSYAFPKYDTITDDEKIMLFNFYNFSGTPQTEEHKNKLRSLLKK